MDISDPYIEAEIMTMHVLRDWNRDEYRKLVEKFEEQKRAFENSTGLRHGRRVIMHNGTQGYIKRVKYDAPVVPTFDIGAITKNGTPSATTMVRYNATIQDFIFDKRFE